MMRRPSLFALPLALFLLPLAAHAQYDDPGPGGPGGGCLAGDVVIQTTAALTFDPAVVTIDPGQTVCWQNAGGGMPHNVHAPGKFQCSVQCDPDPSNPTAPAGDPSASAWTVRLTFNSPGTVDYQCDEHASVGMTGQVTVRGAQTSNAGELSFSRSGYQVGEGGGSATITVRRQNGNDGAVSVAWATSDGSAKAGQDYTAKNGTLSWAAGQDAPKTFTVPITDDTAVEGNETVHLALSSPTGGAALASPSQATLTITDNDSAPPSPPASGNGGALRFSLSGYTATEGDGAVTVTVRRTGGSSGAVSVAYATSDGTATSGQDYTATSGILSWANGDTSPKTFDVPLLEDTTFEGNEAVDLALSSPTGGAALGTPAQAEITILDDDGDTSPCSEDAETLCLGAGQRFRVRATFTTGGETKPAGALAFKRDSGLFFFFDDNNAEILVKVLKACIDPFDAYWVFFAATTNVEFRVTVTDTDSGVVHQYSNPQGVAALPVQDTAAFKTCP